MSIPVTVEDVQVIQEAKNLLMKKYKIEEDKAYRFIIHQAMHTRMTKASVAKQILNLGRLP